MHTPDGILMYPVAHIRSDFPTKFGIPKQSGLSQALEARVVFCPEYRSADAVRGLEEFSHIWLLWQFSAAVREGETFSPTVRPPRLGGNKRVGVFASRSPFRPNHIGGFTDAISARVLHAEIPEELLRRVPEEKREPLREVLEQDPRPSYQDDPERVYGFGFAGMEVRFRASNGVLTVLDIQKEE